MLHKIVIITVKSLCLGIGCADKIWIDVTVVYVCNLNVDVSNAYLV